MEPSDLGKGRRWLDSIGGREALKTFEGEMGTTQLPLKEENTGCSCRMDQSREWRLVTEGCHRGNRKGGMFEKAGWDGGGRTRLK